jgi:hypothetical protein
MTLKQLLRLDKFVAREGVTRNVTSVFTRRPVWRLIGEEKGEGSLGLVGKIILNVP